MVESYVNIYLFNDEVDVQRTYIGRLGDQEVVILGMSETCRLYHYKNMSGERLDSLHCHHLY